MDKSHSTNARFQAVAWGILYLWWGLRWWPLAFLPNGSGLLVTAAILFGANIAHNALGHKTLPGNTKLGVLTFALGALLLFSDLFGKPANVPLFEAVLIGIGAIYLFSGVFWQPGVTAKSKTASQ